MEVTRENFAAVADEFCSLLQTCDFYALDEEMTGISLPSDIETPVMPVATRYDIKRRVAERYSILQVGICLFHREPAAAAAAAAQQAKPAFVARPFTFLLFPTAVEDRNGQLDASLRSDVVLSASAMAFLTKHGMNFQRWVYHGVPYCSEAQEHFLRKQHADEAAQREAQGSEAAAKSLSKADQQWLREALATARAFATSTQGALPAELVVPRSNSRAARDALRASVEKQNDNLLVAFRGRAATRDTILIRVTPEERARKVADDIDARERALLDSIGFRKIFNALTACRKPMVGHNCFVDILFLLAALDRPLPVPIQDFQRRLADTFPLVFDTKFISTQTEYFPKSRFETGTYLGGLYDSFTAPNSSLVNVTLPLGFHAYDTRTLEKRNGGKGAAHEAGYDALMTGTVFLNLLQEARLLPSTSETFHAASSAFGNRVALFRSLFAFDISSAKDAEMFLPKGSVLLLEHPPSLTTSQVESILTGTPGCPELQVMSVDRKSSIAASFDSNFDPADATTVVKSLNAKFSPETLRAAIWSRPSPPVPYGATAAQAPSISSEKVQPHSQPAPCFSHASASRGAMYETLRHRISRFTVASSMKRSLSSFIRKIL